VPCAYCTERDRQRSVDSMKTRVKGNIGRWGLGLAALIASAALAQQDATRGRVSVSCERIRNLFLAPVSVNGQSPAPFLLDAGLGHPVLDTMALQPEEGEGAPPPVAPAMRPTVDLQVGEGLALTLRAPMVDLSGLKARLGRPVAGMLPAHQPGFATVLDYDMDKVTWTPLDADSAAPAGPHVVEMNIAGGIPRVRALIDGRLLHEVEVDITFPGTLALHKATLAGLGALANEADQLESRGPNGGRWVQMRLAALAVAGHRMEGPVCTVAGEAGPERIGAGFLQHFRVTLHYEQGRLQLQRRTQGPLAAPPVAGVGLAPAAFDGRYWQLRVARESPADRAGIEAGGRLVGINGDSAAGVKYESLARALSTTEGETVTVTIRGARGDSTVTLTSEPLL